MNRSISVLATYSDKDGVLYQQIIDKVPNIILSDSVESDKIIDTIEKVIGGTVQTVVPLIYRR